MLDMIRPASSNRITLQDLKRCKMTPVFFDTFFNLEKYLDHEQRDPFATQREVDEDGNEVGFRLINDYIWVSVSRFLIWLSSAFWLGQIRSRRVRAACGRGRKQWLDRGYVSEHSLWYNFSASHLTQQKIFKGVTMKEVKLITWITRWSTQRKVEID